MRFDDVQINTAHDLALKANAADLGALTLAWPAAITNLHLDYATTDDKAKLAAEVVVNLVEYMASLGLSLDDINHRLGVAGCDANVDIATTVKPW